MGWADSYIEKLKAGEPVEFRPSGNSMTGKINSGQLVRMVPLEPTDLKIGDIVLCKVNGSQYLHLVKAKRAGQYLIGNNKGHINGWTKRENIFGVVHSVSP